MVATKDNKDRRGKNQCLTSINVATVEPYSKDSMMTARLVWRGKMQAKIEEIEISKLIPNPLNVKKHPKEQINDLAIQIQQEPGFTNPLIIDEDYMIWVGHGRLEAVKSLGWDKIPCIMVHNMSEGEKYRYMIKDNQVNESPWIKENLQIAFDKVDPILFEPFEMDVQDIGVKLPIEEESEPVPEPPTEAKAKSGDIYKLGRHTLVCGSSLDVELPKAEMVFTDPPYGLGGYAGRSGNFKPIEGDDQDPKPFYHAIPECKERYIWGNWECLAFMPKPRDIIIWKKNNFGMGRGYRGQYEICLYYGEFSGSDSDVWEIPKDNVAGYQHPTQKPTALATRALYNSTKEGDLVLDMYAGSGSTLMACEQTGRVCYAIEYEPAYIDVIIERWENHTGKQAVKVTPEINVGV